MINYKNPTVELIPDAIALDAAIEAVRVKLAAISWLTKAFGRVTIQVQKVAQKEIQDRRLKNENVVPEMYYKREPFSLMPNDNLQAYCFFVAGDDMEFVDYDPNERYSQDVKQPIAIIFWANLEKIDPSKNYNFMEALRKDCIQVFKKCPRLVIESSSIEFDRVFDPFTITENFKTYLKPPYTAFRFDGTLTFDYLKC